MDEATALQRTESEEQRNEELVIYTDGSCILNGTADAKAGCGIWYGNEDPRNTGLRVPGQIQSNQIGELLAVLHVTKETPGNQDLKICSDSRFAIDDLTKHVREWEAKGWIGQGVRGSAPKDTQPSKPLWTPELPPDPPILGNDPPPHSKVIHI